MRRPIDKQRNQVPVHYKCQVKSNTFFFFFLPFLLYKCKVCTKKCLGVLFRKTKLGDFQRKSVSLYKNRLLFFLGFLVCIFLPATFSQIILVCFVLLIHVRIYIQYAYLNHFHYWWHFYIDFGFFFAFFIRGAGNFFFFFWFGL